MNVSMKQKQTFIENRLEIPKGREVEEGRKKNRKPSLKED